MKKIGILLVFMGIGIALNAQWRTYVIASDITGADTILKGYDSRPSDVSDHFWICKISTSENDTIQVEFGGRLKYGKFTRFASSELPYTIRPGDAQKIEDGDTVYQTYFTGGLLDKGRYGFKTPELKITKLNAVDSIDCSCEFIRP